jgi:hypothetical protein
LLPARTKKVRFPKGKKDQGETFDVAEEGGPIIAADARAVATSRAVKRKEKGKNKLKEDTDVGTNVGIAEQDYEVIFHALCWTSITTVWNFNIPLVGLGFAFPTV